MQQGHDNINFKSTSKNFIINKKILGISIALLCIGYICWRKLKTFHAKKITASSHDQTLTKTLNQNINKLPQDPHNTKNEQPTHTPLPSQSTHLVTINKAEESNCEKNQNLVAEFMKQNNNHNIISDIMEEFDHEKIASELKENFTNFNKRVITQKNGYIIISIVERNPPGFVLVHHIISLQKNNEKGKITCCLKRDPEKQYESLEEVLKVLRFKEIARSCKFKSSVISSGYQPGALMLQEVYWRETFLTKAPFIWNKNFRALDNFNCNFTEWKNSDVSYSNVPYEIWLLRTHARKTIRLTAYDIGQELSNFISNTPTADNLLYVWGTDNKIYVTNQNREFSLHHSGLKNGGCVWCAGNLSIKNGKIISIDNSSGHYKPSAAHFDKFEKFIKTTNFYTPEINSKTNCY